MGSVAVAILTAILIGALYLGREVFVPIALAVLLSFVLAPLVRLLQRCHVPRGLSVVSVVLIAFVSTYKTAGRSMNVLNKRFSKKSVGDSTPSDSEDA